MASLTLVFFFEETEGFFSLSAAEHVLIFIAAFSAAFAFGYDAYSLAKEKEQER